MTDYTKETERFTKNLQNQETKNTPVLKNIGKGLKDTFWGLFPFVFIVAVVSLIWWSVSPISFDRFLYGLEYDTDSAHISMDSKPHDCDHFKAPIGDKECHFEKSVTTDKDEHGKIEVYVSWDKVDK